MIRQRIVDGLDLRVGQQRFVTSIGLLDSQFCRRIFRLSRVARSNGRDFAPLSLLHRGNHFSHRNSCYSEHSPLHLVWLHSNPSVADCFFCDFPARSNTISVHTPIILSWPVASRLWSRQHPRSRLSPTRVMSHFPVL